MKGLLLRYLLAAAGGVLWGLCFSKEPFSVASWLALAPLMLLLSGPHPGRLGWVHGFAAWMTGLYWIVPTLQTYGGMPEALSVVLTGVLAAYLALFHAAFAWLGAPVWRRWPAARIAALPALWVALEWLRTYLGGGFPWNLAGYAWVDMAGALPLSAWVGVYGISFFVVLSGVAVASAVQRRSWRPLASLLVPLLLLPLAGRWSVRREAEEIREIGGLGKPVRLLQPNIPNLAEPDWEVVQRNFQKVVDQSLEACQPGALVVWPESAAWPYLYSDPSSPLARELAALTDRGCTVLFNNSHPVEESFYNSAYLLSAAGTVARYDKRHLVPFGEYVPFKGVFGWMDKLARNAGDFRRADENVLLPWSGEKIGMSICYEIVFPDEVADSVQAGATLLMTITNDAWYGDTSAPWQHFRAARFRAAENRRPLLRAAITGVSAFVGPDGSVRAQLGVFQEGMIRARVFGEEELTLYSRAPWLVPLLASLAAAVAVYFARRRSSR